MLGAGFALLCLVWGTTWAAIRVGLEGIPPFTGVSLRFALAAAVLLAAGRVMGVPVGRTRRERALWLVNTILSFCVSYGVVYWAEQWVPSGLAAVLFATFPLFVAVLAHAFLPGERLTAATVTGVLVGFAGVAVIFAEDLAALGGPEVRTAALVMLLSPFAAALANVCVKRWGGGIHPISLTAVPMGLCALVMGGVAWVSGEMARVSWTPASVAALVYLACVGSALAFTLYYWLLSHMTATRLSLITYLTPVVAVALGVALLDEPITAQILAGGALVIGGVALAGRR